LGSCGGEWSSPDPLFFTFPLRLVIMNKISFSEAFDKFKPNRFYEGVELTTFRGYTARKDRYYHNVKNQQFYIVLKDHAIGKAILKRIHYRWSDELTEEEIKKDTYSHWTKHDWENFLENIYENRKVFGFWLIFEVIKTGPINKTLDLFMGGEHDYKLQKVRKGL